MRARVLRTLALAGALALGAATTVAVQPAQACQGWGDLLPCGGKLAIEAPASVGVGADWSPLSLVVTESGTTAYEPPVLLDVSADVPLVARSVLVQVQRDIGWVTVPLTVSDGHLVGPTGAMVVKPQERSTLDLRLAVTDVVADADVEVLPTRLTVKASLHDPSFPIPVPSSTPTSSASATATSTPSPSASASPSPTTPGVYVASSVDIAVKQLSIDAPADVTGEQGEPIELEATVTNKTGTAYHDVLVAPLVTIVDDFADECDVDVEGSCDFGNEGDTNELGAPGTADRATARLEGKRRALDEVSTTTDLAATLALLNGIAEVSDATVEFEDAGSWVDLADVTDPSALPLVDLADGATATTRWRITVDQGTDDDDDAVTWLALRVGGPVDEAPAASLVASSSTVTFAGVASSSLSLEWVEGNLPSASGGPTLPATGSGRAGGSGRAAVGLLILGAFLVLVTRRERTV